MRFISLFAGVGGFDLAMERAGHECVYANDIDKYCKIIYDKQFKRELDCRSIKDVSTDEIPDHEILVGGFPCQSFSIAGKRKGFEDTRGTLFFDIARIVKAKRPRYFILENVKGLLSHDNGRTFKTIIATIDELGYDCQWQVLNSKNFGVPQNRERVFIVGHLRGECRPKIFPIIQEINPNTTEQKSTETAIARTRTAGGHSGGNHSGMTIIGTLRTHNDGKGFREMKSGLSPTIPAHAREDGSGQPVVAVTERRNEKAKQIRKEMLKNGIDWSPRREKELVARTDGKIGTLTAARNFDTMLLDNMKLRRLTPIECERLQGFPDNWTQGISDTQRYKMCGNAVTVNVVYEIARLLTLSIDK